MKDLFKGKKWVKDRNGWVVVEKYTKSVNMKLKCDKPEITPHTEVAYLISSCYDL